MVIGQYASAWLEDVSLAYILSLICMSTVFCWTGKRAKKDEATVTEKEETIKEEPVEPADSDDSDAEIDVTTSKLLLCHQIVFTIVYMLIFRIHRIS